MDLLALISGMLTPEFISELLAKFKKNHTKKYPIRELIYGKGIQHPFASISMADLQRELSNVPVVRRGTEAYALDKGTGEMVKIDPNGVDVSDFVSAADLNDLALIFQQQGEKAIKGYLETRINDMLIVVQKTIEAMAAQSLTGTIAYPMKTDAGIDMYTIEFGDPIQHALDTKLTASSTITELFMLLEDMHEAMQLKDYGDVVKVLAGRKAYSIAMTIATAKNQSTIKAVLGEQGEIIIGGYSIMKQTGKYKGVNNAMTDKIASNAFCMVDTNANHKLYYLALDDIKAGNKPMPFFATHDIKTNPSGLEILGKSKPLPAPIVNAICWCEVVA
ncbi:major capsid protein [Vibrio sp. OPT18]|uniref:major capsid protein n=1 Tax=Vibrio sp. OPT18 TaxID=2778641 RepID=UPI0018822167|nr:major capsid protein [Vibrio sp. OPT18]MBE8578719.1 major capsid protein [Vibrio sp. OPT18]